MKRKGAKYETNPKMAFGGSGLFAGYDGSLR